MVHLDPLSFATPRITWINFFIVFHMDTWGGRNLACGTVIWATYGDWGKRLPTNSSITLDLLLFHPLVGSSTTFIFFAGIIVPNKGEFFCIYFTLSYLVFGYVSSPFCGHLCLILFYRWTLSKTSGKEKKRTKMAKTSQRRNIFQHE